MTHLAGGGIKFGSGSVAVWALATVAPGAVKENEFEIITSRKDSFYRQRAQEGFFTRLTHDVHCDVESYLASRDLATYLERYEIPGQEMGKALSDLELMGITTARLFPDLEGAAAQANIGSTIRQLGR